MNFKYRSKVSIGKKKKKLITPKRVIILLISIAIIYVGLFLIVVPERPNYAFFAGKEPLVVAYQGGAKLAPKNTHVAFEKARSLGVDAIQFQVRMTKDGVLVVFDEDTVDSSTNGKGKVAEMSLAELKELDAAYRFPGIRGNYEYRGHGVTIPTVKEIFEQFKDMRFLIEIKEVKKEKSEETEQGTESSIAQKLWELIEAYNMQKKVIISAESSALLQEFMQYSQGQVIISASNQETTKFTLLHKLFLNRLYRPKSDIFQVDPHQGIFNMSEGRIIAGAERLNMKILYRVINEQAAESLIRDLLSKGVDGIITDRPDLLIRVINEMGLRDE